MDPATAAADAPETTEVVIVGAGQAGVAMSEHLTRAGIEHVVLERDRIAEKWRTGRWDSLVANGPAWHDRFPTMEIPGVGPDDFATKDQMAEYFTTHARSFDAPIRTGVEVLSVDRRPHSAGFDVTTSAGNLRCRFVVTATGPFQVPTIPQIVPSEVVAHQIHSAAYRNPEQLPEGGVLVVGAGSSGAQIADELRRAGREVHLSVGPHDRPPRSYRGRDFVWWLGVLGMWDAEAPDAGTEHRTIAVSGARGGHTVDFRDLADRGITLLGRTVDARDGEITFADDLGRNIAHGDRDLLALLDAADAYIERTGLDLPAEPTARELGPLPQDALQPIRRLDAAASGITSIIWATGYRLDHSWLHADAFDAAGRPTHHRGVSTEPGVYFLGLPWQSRRGSSFVWGVWHDAKYIADHIGIQRGYAAYRPQVGTVGAVSPIPSAPETLAPENAR